MNMLNVPGVFGICVGIVGLAFIADAASEMTTSPIQGDPAGAFSVPSLDVSKLFSLAARADEMPAPDDLSDLLRIDLPRADVEIDYSVGRHVQSSVSVTKIAYGQVSDVRVYSTATGTYSTDGLASPHVQYPGIEVSDWRVRRAPRHGGYIWEGGFGWIPVPEPHPQSFMTYRVAPAGPHASGARGMECTEQAGVVVCG